MMFPNSGSGKTSLQRKGQWLEDKILGSGGFGTVVLWKNEETKENLALKKCRLQNEMSAKHRQRWILEVDIMKRLEHENVIVAMEVPPDLDVPTGELPLMAMEYCSGGDLRKVLNLPENCCGLKEFAIRCLAHDIAAAVEYLHGKRIIHRDLKPENIVLQPSEDRIMYKLIDLGYAKDLDQGSVCTSFVGTLQYLAPDLLQGQKYTCTVDYWSFGTVMFECTTGFRPFLPNLNPVQWHREVSGKGPDQIYAWFEKDGSVKFSSKLPSPNHLNRALQAYMEQWLRFMLRWDAKARGGGLADNRPQCFVYLDKVLTIKTVHILHVSSNKLMSYPVPDHYTMQELQKNIEQETKIPEAEQDILLASGLNPVPDQPAIQCWTEAGDEDWVVFLFRKGEDNVSRRFKPLPQLVQTIVRDSSLVLPYQEQKRSWAEAVYFCNEQLVDFKRLVLSQRAAVLSLLRTNSTYSKLKSNMVNECDHLIAKTEYFKLSLQYDMEMYGAQANNGGVSSEKMFQAWQKTAENVNLFLTLKERVSELDQQSTALQTKILELQRSPFARTKQNEVLEEMENRSKALYRELRETPSDQRDHKFRDQQAMMEVVVKCIMQRDKSLHDLYTHLGKINICKFELLKTLPELEKCCNEIKEANDQLLIYQRQRQADIWKLVKVALARQTGVGRQGSRSSSGSNTSLMSASWTDTCHESLHVMEETKVTTKQFTDLLESFKEVQEEQMSILSSMDWGHLKQNDKK